MAMLFHRFGTLSHILAATEITNCGKEEDVIAPTDAAADLDGVRLIRRFQKLKHLDGERKSDNCEDQILIVSNQIFI